MGLLLTVEDSGEADLLGPREVGLFLTVEGSGEPDLVIAAALVVEETEVASVPA